MKSADELQVPTKNVYNAGMNVVLTKRGILSIVASLYDPYGIIAPVVISFKVFFQKLAVAKIGWDEPLPGELQVEWLKLLDILSDDSLFKIQRYYFGGIKLGHFEKFTLHGFCDASDIAYAAVVYIVGIASNQILSSFVTAKTKVAPLVKPSTPVMELYGCVLLSDLVSNVKEALTEEISFSGVVCWSDSLDSLHWIKNEKKTRPRAIQTRVVKIRRQVAAGNWRHCPTKLNPADIASRGMPTQRVVQKEFPSWIVGPEFIVTDSTKWPVDLSLVERAEKKEEDVVSVNCAFEPSTLVVCLHVTDTISERKVQKVKVHKRRMQLDSVISIERFGYLQKLLRVTALVLRFIGNKRRGLRNEALLTGYLKPDELAYAEYAWIKTVQRHLEADSKQLNNTLGLILNEDGVLLCKGRLQKAELTPSQINPILIPGDSYFARLLVQDAHLRTGHGTKKETLVELRSRFWVTKGRNLVHHVLLKCARPCRRLESKAFNSVETPPLPGFRVRQSFPFSTTGVDYLGPLLVRQVFDEHDVNMYKVWIVLYTCAVTRAVHLDVVPNLSASAFLRSLKRFIGRRGVPSLMISDNATCFKNEEVKLNAELIQLRVKWKFIVEAAPWWGGFWERLVQTVKRSLRKILFRSSVTYEELETVVANVEGIVNSRPLTYIYDDDVEEVLTPSHLLLGRRLLSTFDHSFEDGAEVDNAVLTKRMKYLKSLSDHYWKRFKEEYLLELRSQHAQGSDPSRSPVVGEVVVLEGLAKRNSWRLGKIVSLIHGSDNRCRAAVVKTFDGTSSHLTRRPIEKLYPIEIRSEVPVEESDKNNDDIVTSGDIVTSSDDGTSERPRRVAADTGILRRRLANIT